MHVEVIGEINVDITLYVTFRLIKFLSVLSLVQIIVQFTSLTAVNSVAGIAARYGLEVSGFEPR